MPHDDIAITQATAADYSTLARFHYRPARPGPCVHALSAVDQLTGELVGILTISMPTLNGPWRSQAWPRLFPRGRATARHKRSAATRVNRHLRTISRVVVDPRYRALGIARRLVQAYVANPLTRCTEAVASMGHMCPFFATAGMRELSLPPSRRDCSFSKALKRVGVEPWELMDVDRAASVVRASPSLRHSLFTWASYSRATRKYLDPVKHDNNLEALESVAVLAAASLTARPLVYVSGE